MAEKAVQSPDAPIAVSHLTRYIKYLIERDEILTSLSVRGEVCELSRSPAGHIYLTLKDADSQVSCVLFRREAAQAGDLGDLRKGVSVVVHGFLTVYKPRGTYQIYVERLVVEGDGAAHARLLRLREKLDREGLFAEDRKRPIPPFPRKLALVTSPGSQAYHDVLHRLKNQYPFVTVIEAGVSVQGEGAADGAVLALDVINRMTDADLVLMVRGGGAPEDLASFNDERLARAIYASRIPVITGIGHETDWTIADLVADFRAATPSLAAAAAVPDVSVLVARARKLHGEMELAARERLARDRGRWREFNRSLLRASPRNRLRTQRQRADDLSRLANRAIRVHLRTKRQRVEGLRAHLDALDPLAILARGYAVLTDRQSGRVISTLSQVNEEMRLRAQVSDGSFLVRVEDE